MEINTNEIPVNTSMNSDKNSDSHAYPPVPDIDSAVKETLKKDPDTIRETKTKRCPGSVDQFDPSLDSGYRPGNKKEEALLKKDPVTDQEANRRKSYCPSSVDKFVAKNPSSDFGYGSRSKEEELFKKDPDINPETKMEKSSCTSSVDKVEVKISLSNSGYQSGSKKEELLKKDQERDPDGEAKRRRKSCPTSLDKLEAKNVSLNSGFSFSFESKSAGTPEFTPKFGSFKSIASTHNIDECSKIPAESLAKEHTE